MRHQTRFLGVVLVFGLSAQTAFAQSNKAFSQLVSDPREQEMVLGAAKRSNVVLESPCEDAHYSIANQFSIVESLALDDAGAIRSGVWKQTVNYSGCGATRILNVLVSLAAGPRANAYPLMPGMTHADPRLQLDVFRSPAMQLQIEPLRDPACTKVYVADTVFVSRESATLPGAKEPGWHELWTVVACDHRASIPVTFTPDATGTTFTLAAGRP